MIDLAKRINLSQETVSRLERLVDEKRDEIEACAERCRNKGFGCLKRKDGLFRLAVILRLSLDLKKKYELYGIGEEIYYHTLSDIKIWTEKTGGRGIKNYGWLKNHLSFELFRLGRLQFQLYPCKNKTLLYGKLPFSYADNLIYVHIPEGEPLSAEECRRSFKTAVDFFGKYFPDYEYGYFFCESWLLFEGNREFMKKDSNIVSFMKFFDICYSLKIDKQAIERIYTRRSLFKKFYAENTSLQKRAKEYMLSGKSLGIGVGVMKKEKAEQSFSIRYAVAEDTPDIASLYRSNHISTYKGLLSEEYFRTLTEEFAAEKWSAYISDSSKKVWVAEEDGSFLGFAAAMEDEKTENTWYLDSLHVSPTARGRGVGTALVKAAGNYACNMNYGKMSICYVKGNDRAGDLYKKLGAEVYEDFTDDFCGTSSNSRMLIWKNTECFK